MRGCQVIVADVSQSRRRMTNGGPRRGKRAPSRRPSRCQIMEGWPGGIATHLIPGPAVDSPARVVRVVLRWAAGTIRPSRPHHDPHPGERPPRQGGENPQHQSFCAGRLVQHRRRDLAQALRMLLDRQPVVLQPDHGGSAVAPHSLQKYLGAVFRVGHHHIHVVVERLGQPR